MTDNDIAVGVRAAVALLNQRLAEAERAGLQVCVETDSRIGVGVTVIEVKMARPI